MEKKSKTRFKQTEIGMIPEDWNVGRLGDYVEKIFVGRDPSGGKHSHSTEITKYRIVQSAPVFDGYLDEEKISSVSEEMYLNLKSASIKEDDVLLNQLGDGVTFARSCVVPRRILPAIITRSVGCIRCNKNKIEPWFLNAYLVIPKTKKYIESFNSGSSRRAIDGGKMRSFTIPLPPLEEQKRIGFFYKTMQDKKELNQQMNKNLEAIAKTIFKHWFIDFEFPNGEGKPYKYSGGEMVYNEELGKEIPKGWKVIKNISDLCDKINYGYTQSASEDKIGPKFLRVMDINKGDWISWNDVPYCEIKEKDTQKYLLERGDIIIARMADPGKLAIFEHDIPAVFASYLIRIRLKEPEFAYYIYYLMKSKYYQEFILGAATGSVQRSLNAKGLTNGLPIFLPSNQIIEKFNRIVEKLRAKINGNVFETEQLSKIRDSLLPKLISGKIRVPVEAE